MLINNLTDLFDRDLNRLQTEIELYKDEKTLWKLDGSIANTGGNLCLHLIGNLNHFIGTIIGKTGYLRDRESEFTLKDIPRDELIGMIVSTQEMVSEVLDNIDPVLLEENYPEVVFDQEMTYGYFLIRLITHLNYHLGQINYHRRMLDV